MEVSEDVRVGVGPMEFQLYTAQLRHKAGIPRRRHRHWHPREYRRENVRVSFTLPWITSIARVGRVGEDPREYVGVGVVEFQLNGTAPGVNESLEFTWQIFIFAVLNR